MAPPPPPPPPVPELLAELVEEVLIRFPPDDPASLVRAALVCRLWRRLVSAAAFRRRFREFHRTSPLLGVLCQGRGGDDDVRPTTRFIPTSSFRPAHPVRYGWHAIDARHGRVLLECWPWEVEKNNLPRSTKLAVWDPVTDEQQELHLPMQFNVHPSSLTWAAAVICAAGGDCDHIDCNWGSFNVVLVNIERDKIWSSIYSPKTGAWSQQTITYRSSTYTSFKSEPGVLIGNALYCLLDMIPEIVKYDLSTQQTSVIDMPPEFHPQHIVLVTMENGRLGFAAIDKCGLYINLWSRVVGPDGPDAGFVQCRVINLPNVFNSLGTSLYVSGFAHGVGVLFIWTLDGLLYIMDIKSEEVRKVPTTRYCHGCADVVPYSSFHTPALGAATTIDGPRSSSSIG